ncbi:MAG: hypothetical protein IPL03_00675 [Sterolibacteriaceae bacterium]|jgi:hypothetical protein|nr:hypothetical protein [Candidatus Methylophosphatis haderslevensis]
MLIASADKAVRTERGFSRDAWELAAISGTTGHVARHAAPATKGRL